MSAKHFAQLRNPIDCDKKVVAFVYPTEEFPGEIFGSLARRGRDAGLSISGVLQWPVIEGGDHRCDVILEDLASGHRTELFENRGPGARGCRLDTAALADIAARIEGSLEKAPDLLILNKYGKVECEGGGFRDLIANAIDREIIVVIGVPQRNLNPWREFAGDLAVEISGDGAALQDWISDRLLIKA